MLLVAVVVLLRPAVKAVAKGGGTETQVPILVYHRFGPVVADSMTITTATFAAHLRYLHEHGYSVIPLRQYVR